MTPWLRRRRIGLGDVSADFDWQGTVNTGQSLVNQGQDYARSLTALKNTVQGYVNQPSDQQQKEAFGALITGLNFVIPGAGLAFQTLLDNLPHAGAGPGVCTTNPPSGPFDTSWPYYKTYTSYYGSYPTTPGTFEDFAYALIEKNYELFANCYSAQAMQPNLVLASAISTWNDAHEATSQRTISRSGLLSFAGSNDPIAYALSFAVPMVPGPGGWGVVPAPGAPDTLSFTINDGPKKKQLNLHLGPGGGITSAAPSSGGVTATQVALGTAAAAVIGTGIYAWLKHEAYSQVWKKIWNETKKPFKKRR
jgi:hypothetical protein